MAETIRAFIAIRPSAEVVERLQTLQKDLRSREWAGELRWTAASNIHLTLLFLGNVETGLVPDIVSSLKVAVESTPPIRLECGGLGCFPNARNPSVLWVGLAGETDRLIALHAKVLDQCGRFAAKLEARAFHPHLTLARARSFDRRHAVSLEGDLSSFRRIDCQGWRAGAVSVIQSHLGSAGAAYSDLATVPLDL